ncbi:hypothetical protein J437_LFUL018906, partial [Ladona fulva]
MFLRHMWQKLACCLKSYWPLPQSTCHDGKSQRLCRLVQERRVFSKLHVLSLHHSSRNVVCKDKSWMLSRQLLILFMWLLCNTDFSKHYWKTPKIKKSDGSADVKFYPGFYLIESINEFMQLNLEKFMTLHGYWIWLSLPILLNILNLDLQDKDKELAQMMGSVKAFKAKLTLWMSQMRSKSLVHFLNMKKMMNYGNFEPSRFTGHLKTLLNQFEKRFQDYSCLEPVVSFFVNPFNIHHKTTETATAIARIIASEVENLELEIVDQKNV